MMMQAEAINSNAGFGVTAGFGRRPHSGIFCEKRLKKKLFHGSG